MGALLVIFSICLFVFFFKIFRSIMNPKIGRSYMHDSPEIEEEIIRLEKELEEAKERLRELKGK